MVDEAAKYKDEDDKQKSRIESKNSLESYCFQMKTAVDDEKIGAKLKEEDKEKIKTKCNEVIAWLDANQSAEKDEFDHMREETEKVCNPIMGSIYQGANP